MRAVDYLIDTVSHFAKGVEGPPPGVPFRADAEFETELVSLCRHQQLSTLVSVSFDELALPPKISRITVARINHYATITEDLRRRRIGVTRRVMASLAVHGVRAALLGDVRMASTDSGGGSLRPVDVINVLIDEKQWVEAVGVLREAGFVRSRIQPRLAGLSDSPAGAESIPGRMATTKRAAADALRYHHYFAPLLMHNHDGDVVQLRFRVIDFSHPSKTNPSWDRLVSIEIDGINVPAVCIEDELIHTVVSLGAEGFVDLLLVLDAGRLLSRYGETIDWNYIMQRLRDKKMYPAFYFTLEHICELLNIPRTSSWLEDPPAWRRWMFRRCWKPEDTDYSGETEPWAGRFSFGLIECCGPWSKLVWLRRSLFPRSAWVRSVYGRPANLWLRLRFLYDVRSSRHRRLAGPAQATAEISELNRNHE